MYRLPRSLTLRHTPSLIRRPGVRIPRIPHQRRFKSTQVWYRNDGTPIRLQTVRFKKPGIFTMRRLATVGLYTGIVYGYLRFMWSYMDVEIEFLDDEEEELAEQEAAQDAEGEEVDEEEEEDGPPFYADEQSTFIPLTWAKQMPRTFYRGSDPEWQEFIKIARDKPRHKKIQDELVQIVYAGSVNHPSITRQLGKDAKIGKYWLDISFPDGPPQEYERSGIEIGDGFIAWSQQRVSQEKQWRLMRALWPQATAQSSWATVKVLGGIQWRRIKQLVGWGEVDPHAPEERFRLATEMMKQQGQEQGKVGKTQTDPNGRPGDVVTRDNASASTTASRPAARPASRREEDPASKNFWIPSVPIPQYPFSTKSASSAVADQQDSTDPHSGSEIGNLDIPIAMHVFQSTLSKSWNPKKMEPPRGTFVVQGLVEVRGQRGRMLFDVSSAYDPRQGKFVHVNAAVRGFKRWSQPPRGGP